ncbi:hypothetical protein FNV43_RR05483 [Rhamnella rubrinervis]|uniref:Uncharacterized protein n=1 Tax=Rhamnella rubrinervis TaxID=2594499 RepID=A0A8K0HM86_9ROSA|nr:hypothetical protein FNV43_RR05483 [Rhamnella rubrinervis]
MSFMWKPPHKKWLKINVDVAFKENKTGVFIVHKEVGKVIFASTKVLGSGCNSAFEIEVLALDWATDYTESCIWRYLFVKVVQAILGILFLGTIIALFKVIFLHRARNSTNVPFKSPSKEHKDQPHLTTRQLGLLGIKPKAKQFVSESSKKPPKSKPYSASSPSDALVPFHQPITSSNRSSWIKTNKSNSSGGNMMGSISNPSKSPNSSSYLFLVLGYASPLSSVHNLSGLNSVVSTPWSTNTSGTTRNTLSRPVRMSPGNASSCQNWHINNISPVGRDLPTSGTAIVSSIDRTMEWQPTVTLDKDGLLHHYELLSSKLLMLSHQYPQQNPMFPLMQEVVNVISEHQRPRALIKGEWVKGLLPQSSVRVDYTVKRIQELAKGTCLKNYEYLGSGESHPGACVLIVGKQNPQFLPCTGIRSCSFPFRVGIRDRLMVGFDHGLFWGLGLCLGSRLITSFGVVDLQLALGWDLSEGLGRTTLWDSILLLCQRIKVAYGGIVRGMHLGSSALSILPILESENED